MDDKPDLNYWDVAGCRLTLLSSEVDAGEFEVWLGLDGAFDREGQIIGTGPTKAVALLDARNTCQTLAKVLIKDALRQ